MEVNGMRDDAKLKLYRLGLLLAIQKLCGKTLRLMSLFI